MSLKKFALVEVAASGLIDTEDEFISKVARNLPVGDDANVQKVVKYDPDFVYVRFKAIGSLEVDGPNANSDGFPYFEFLDNRPGYGYQSFIGKHAFVEHDSNNINNSIGSLYAAYLNRFDTSKFGNKEWQILNDDERAKVLASREDYEDGSIEVLMAVDRKLAPKIARMLDKDAMTACSMGTNIDYSECTVCGNRAHVEEAYCPHIRFSKGQQVLVPAAQISDLLKKGTLRTEWLPYVLSRKEDVVAVKTAARKMVYAKAFEINYGLGFFELSIVANPAFSRGYKLEKIAGLEKPSFKQLMPFVHVGNNIPVEINFKVSDKFFDDVLYAYARSVGKPFDQWSQEEKILFAHDGNIARDALSSGNVQEVLIAKRNAPYLIKGGIELIPSDDPGFYQIVNPVELLDKTFVGTRVSNVQGAVGTLEREYFACAKCRGVFKRGVKKVAGRNVRKVSKVYDRDISEFKNLSICPECVEISKYNEGDHMSKSAGKDVHGDLKNPTVKSAEYSTLPTTSEYTGDKTVTEGDPREEETKLYKGWAEKGSKQIESEKETRPMGTIFIDAIVTKKTLGDKIARICELIKSAKILRDRTRLAIDSPRSFIDEMLKGDSTPSEGLGRGPGRGLGPGRGPLEMEDVEVELTFEEDDLPTVLDNTKHDLECILDELERAESMLDKSENEVKEALANRLRWGRRQSVAAQEVSDGVDSLIQDAEAAVGDAIDKLDGAYRMLEGGNSDEEGEEKEKREEGLRSKNLENDVGSDKEGERPKMSTKNANLELNDQNIRVLERLQGVLANAPAVSRVVTEGDEEKEKEKEEAGKEEDTTKSAGKDKKIKQSTAQPPTGARDPGDYGDPGAIESFEMRRWWQDMYPEFEKMKATEQRTELNLPEGRVELLTGPVGDRTPDNPEVGKQTNVPAVFAKRFVDKWVPRKTFYGVVKVGEGGDVDAFIANFDDVAGNEGSKDEFDTFTSDGYLDEIVRTVKTDGIEAARKQMGGKIAQLEGITPGKTEKVNPLYDTGEGGKDSNSPRESMRPDLEAGHGKGEDKAYYTAAYGDEGYAADLTKANTKIAKLEGRIKEFETEKMADIVSRRALHLARMSASRGIIPFDLPNIQQQATEYVHLDERGLNAVKAQLEKLPVTNRRALEAYQIPEAENMGAGVVHNTLDSVRKVRYDQTPPENVAPDGIQPSVENNAKLSEEEQYRIRKQAEVVVPQMHADNSEVVGGVGIPDVTKYFNTIENQLKRTGKYEQNKHLLRSNRR